MGAEGKSKVSGYFREEKSHLVFLPPPSPTSSQIVKWSDCCLPLACRPGDPYQLIAKASVDDFSKLGVAFLEDRLQVANGLIPQKIVCKSSSEMFSS